MFKKGVSGNPNGRPKDEIGILIRAKKNLPDEIVKAVYEIMTKSKNEKMVLDAAEFLRDSGWGKPMQNMSLSNPDGEPITFVVRNFGS